jgi:hypothetical protein
LVSAKAEPVFNASIATNAMSSFFMVFLLKDDIKDIVWAIKLKQRLPAHNFGQQTA